MFLLILLHVFSYYGNTVHVLVMYLYMHVLANSIFTMLINMKYANMSWFWFGLFINHYGTTTLTNKQNVIL